MHYSKAFFTSRDGLKLVTHSWKPRTKASFVLTVIHGMGEHGKRYDAFAEFFVAKGFVVTAVDLRGHGESEGKRGHTESFEHILNDICDFITLQESQYKDLKQILYGYSFGGNFLLNYLLTKETNAYAAIASAPALKSNYAPPPMKAFFAKLIRTIYPSFTVSSGVKSSDMFRENKDEKPREKDPLLHSRISLEMALASIEKGVWALENACRINLPLLIMHGTSDKITRHDASADFIEQVDSKLGRIKLYDGLFHDLHHDENSVMILEDVYKWIIEVSH